MSNNPAKMKEWQALQGHKRNLSSLNLSKLFAQDPSRFDNFSQSIDGLIFDYSKQKVTQPIIEKLCDLARACNVEQKRSDMFSGKKINTTENRAALHTALRRPKTDSVLVDGQDIIPNIHNTLNRMQKFSTAVRSGEYKGATNKNFKDVICLGVGGSDTGPRMINEALKTSSDKLRTLFVSNMDGHDIQDALSKCQAETTLILIVSKSFSTQETTANAVFAKTWLTHNLPKDSDASKHLVGISTDKQAVTAFGIHEDHYFPMTEWINGRYSLWSAVGLAICLQSGFDVFQKFLDGAHVMDTHFENTPLEKNIPVLMALIGIWNRNFLEYDALAILPYAQHLLHLPAYLQQLEMESNGKNIDLQGQPITEYKTAPVIFGEIGTIGQHSFYQLLHQGSDIIPCDFIGIIDAGNSPQEHHDQLLHNMLAQGQALMQGHPAPTDDESYRQFEGNRPSTTILIKQANAYYLGMLLALYEHKCFVQGVIWNINSFDQFGVELGKNLSHRLDANQLSEADISTKELFSLIHKPQK